MSDPIEVFQSDLPQPRPKGLTLLRNRDARLSLTIRAKPSGRLRIELVRAGH